MDSEGGHGAVANGRPEVPAEDGDIPMAEDGDGLAAARAEPREPAPVPAVPVEPVPAPKRGMKRPAAAPPRIRRPAASKHHGDENEPAPGAEAKAAPVPHGYRQATIDKQSSLGCNKCKYIAAGCRRCKEIHALYRAQHGLD